MADDNRKNQTERSQAGTTQNNMQSNAEVGAPPIPRQELTREENRKPSRDVGEGVEPQSGRERDRTPVRPGEREGTEFQGEGNDRERKQEEPAA